MNSAVICLIIFGICIILYLINKLPNVIVALSGLVALVLLNIISFDDCFKSFANKNIFLICGMMVLCGAMAKTGLTQSIGEKIIKLSHNNERTLVILSVIITCILSSLVSNIITLIIIYNLLFIICKKNKEINLMNIIMPVSIAAILGGTLTLTGSNMQIIATSIYEKIIGIDKGFTFTTFLIPSGIICTIYTLYVAFIGYPLGKKIFTNREKCINLNLEEKNAPKNNMPNGKKYIALIILIITIVSFLFSNKIAQFIPNFNEPLAAIIAALLCIFTGCITTKEAINEINWR